MNGITIAPASEADIPELIDLLAVLFSIEQDFSPTPTSSGVAWPPCSPRPPATSPSPATRPRVQ
jgi:hypothetical protein